MEIDQSRHVLFATSLLIVFILLSLIDAHLVRKASLSSSQFISKVSHMKVSFYHSSSFPRVYHCSLALSLSLQLFYEYCYFFRGFEVLSRYLTHCFSIVFAPSFNQRLKHSC